VTNLGTVVKLLQREHDRLTKEVKGIAAALEAFGATYGRHNGTRKISAAGRAKIAAAQRARWAEVRANKIGTNGANGPVKRKLSGAARARIAAARRARVTKDRNSRGAKITTPKKRSMSATARRRIAEAQKKRWAAWKAKEAAKS
jgi:hypothetical protein